jgi:hypothetical protein
MLGRIIDFGPERVKRKELCYTPAEHQKYSVFRSCHDVNGTQKYCPPLRLVADPREAIMHNISTQAISSLKTNHNARA